MVISQAEVFNLGSQHSTSERQENGISFVPQTCKRPPCWEQRSARYSKIRLDPKVLTVLKEKQTLAGRVAVGWSIMLCTKRLHVQLPVRAHT